MAGNMNSTYERNGRYVHGGSTEVNNDAVEYWDRKVFDTDLTDTLYTIEEMFEGRPEKLAAIIYGDSRLWWLICQYNAIIDIQSEFVVGKQLKLPTRERVNSVFLTGKDGGIDSKRELIPERKNF